jgi:hypothetical protein
MLLWRSPARPFSFSTFGQGVAISPDGVGFFSYRYRQRLFVLKVEQLATSAIFRVARDLRTRIERRVQAFSGR